MLITNKLLCYVWLNILQKRTRKIIIIIILEIETTFHFYGVKWSLKSNSSGKLFASDLQINFKRNELNHFENILISFFAYQVWLC